VEPDEAEDDRKRPVESDRDDFDDQGAIACSTMMRGLGRLDFNAGMDWRD
jgi:hypothetical protein